MINFVSKIIRSPWALVAAASLLSVVLVGCGGTSTPEGTVQGKVTLNGAPYTNTEVAVVFLSLDSGQAGSADIQSDGTFRIETPLPVGTYTVLLGPKVGEDTAEAPTPETNDQAVPEKYWNEASSDISIEVVEGKNEDVTIELNE